MMVTIVALFAVAWSLRPAASGLGTHQQLGLPPCSTRQLFGIRCPMCGMTTSWSHVAHGNLLAAARVNVGGFLLAGYALVSLEIARRMAWRGRWPSPSVVNVATISLMAILGVTLLDWGWRLVQ